MKIYIENTETSRNITNVFDFKSIESELSKYNIDVQFQPMRQLRKDIWYMLGVIPYNGTDLSSGLDKVRAKVAFVVDFSNDTALAISRGGSDKQIMMLLSSIGNKHINDPFKYDPKIRYEL